MYITAALYNIIQINLDTKNRYIKILENLYFLIPHLIFRAVVRYKYICQIFKCVDIFVVSIHNIYNQDHDENNRYLQDRIHLSASKKCVGAPYRAITFF